MATKRNIEEAKEYLTESIKLWEEQNQEQRIISLSNWAERWRTLADIKVKTVKLKTLKKNNKSFEIMIERNKKLGVDTYLIDLQLKQNIEEIKEIESSFKMPVREKRKSQ